MKALEMTAEGELQSLEQLEVQLLGQLELKRSEVKELERLYDQIGKPEALGERIERVIWEQFQAQIGMDLSQEFIAENNGQALDLRDSAHIQTTENFAEGRIATHNRSIDYQERYDRQQSKFERGADGQIKTHTTRTGQRENNLARGARSAFDQGRPVGSVAEGIDMDHTVSAAELIRRPDVNAHLSEAEQIQFANGEANLHPMVSSHNRSKKDLAMTDWLDTPNSNGQKPSEIFDDLDAKTEARYRENDRQARAELDERLAAGKEEARRTGRSSQLQEAKLAGKKSLKAVLYSLLASLSREVIREFVHWLRSAQRSLSSLADRIKLAIRKFIENLRSHLATAAKVGIQTILDSIFGAVTNLFNKLWSLLQLGFQTIKQVISYFTEPRNSGKSLSVKLAEVTKIIVAMVAAGGAIFLGEAIEKGLTAAFPPLAVPIPVLGSFASVIGLFLSALISGILAAIVINFIDRWIAKKLKSINIQSQIDERNKVLEIQQQLQLVVQTKVGVQKVHAQERISQRHALAGEKAQRAHHQVEENQRLQKKQAQEQQEDLDYIFAALETL